MERNFIYKVEGFSPPQKGREMGGYGFSVYLIRDFAKRARQKIITSETQERFQEIARENIIKRLFSNKYFKPPYSFVEDSLLVQSFHVPGDACDIDADWMEVDSLKDEKSFRNFIEYHPHNVDNFRQAYALFSIFSEWVEYAEALLTE